MARLFPIVEGMTKELGPFTLRIDGSPADLTGITVAVVIHDCHGAAVTFGGTVRMDDTPSTGRVYLKPAVGDFLNALTPYRIRFKGTDGAGDPVFYPDDAAYTVDVFKP